MPDKELTIGVNTKGDASGAKEVGKELGNVTEQTKAGEKAGQALNEAEQKSNSTRRESREILRGLGETFPIVGELGRVAFLGVAGAVMFFIKVVGSALDQIKELGDRGTPEFEKLTDAVKDQKSAIEELELSYAAYERSLKRVSDASQTVQDQAKEFQSGIKSHHDADESILGKSHERDISAIQAAEEMGLITHEEFIVRKLALDEAYFKKRMELENKFQFDQLKGKAQERFASDMEARTLESGLGAKRDAAEKAAGASKFADKKVVKDEANLDKTLAKIEELQKEREAILHPGVLGFLMQSQFVANLKLNQNDAETVAQMQIADKLRALQKKDEHGASSAKNRAAETKEGVDADQERLRKDRERMHQLDIEAPVDLRQYQFDKNRRQQESDIDSDTRHNKAMGDLSSAENKHSEIAGHAASIAASTNDIATSVSDLSDALKKNHDAVAKQFKDLWKAVETTTSQIRSNYNLPIGG